jgi:hypothetical protein
LGYDEGLGAKATLSQEDIRFSRTIARIQRTVLAEMNKIAIIHLYCHGFTDNDLLDFSLTLSNPSTIAQQQKLELFKSRFEAAGTALQTPGLVDKTWVQKNIIRLTEDEISQIKVGQKKDKITELEIEATQISAAEGPSDPMTSGGAPEIEQSIDLGTAPEAEAPGLSESDSVDDEDVPIRIQQKIDSITSLLAEDEDREEDEKLTDDEKREASLKKYQEKRRKRQGKDYAEMGQDFSKLKRDAGAERQNDVSGMPREIDALKSLGKLKFEDINIDEYLDNKIIQNAQITGRIKSTLSRLDNAYGRPKKYTGVISENNSSEGEE